MQKKEDSRVIRSKRDLANALAELLKEKNFDDISIKEITDKALVSKNTFYNNFLDKNDLMSFLLKRYTNKIYEETLSQKDEFNPLNTLKILIEKVVHFLFTNPLELGKILQNDQTKSLYWIFYNFINENIDWIFKEYNKKINVKIPASVIESFYTGAIVNIIYFNATNKKYSEKEVVNYLEILLLTPLATKQLNKN